MDINTRIKVRVNMVKAPIRDFFSHNGIKKLFAYLSPRIAAIASDTIIIKFVMMNRGLRSPQKTEARMKTDIA